MARWFSVLAGLLAALAIGVGCAFFSVEGRSRNAFRSNGTTFSVASSIAFGSGKPRPPQHAEWPVVSSQLVESHADEPEGVKSPSVAEPPLSSNVAFALKELRSNSKCTVFDQRLIGVLVKLTESSLEKLGESAFIADLIREAGLVKDSRPLYGDEAVHQLDTEINSKLARKTFIGTVGMYQLPDQMACALTTLSKLRVTTFMEVGIFTGWTGVFMTTYLRRFAAEFASIGLDITDYQSHCVKAAMDIVGRTFILLPKDMAEGQALKVKAAAQLATEHSQSLVDLCFVDGDHSYKGVHGDVTTLHGSCRLFMLHDVVDRNCAGVRQQWEQLKASSSVKQIWNCTQQPKNLPASYKGTQSLGIGIARMT